ncbi:MAG: hypothetical protein E7566_07925 [Ruminococcaceae bacterium]|nr:hypothetical protein [Oscillospiraceae bacterium]
MELLSLIVAIVSAVVAVVSVAFSFVTYRKAVARDRKQATLEAFNRLQNEVFDHLNHMLPANIREICEDTRCDAYKTLSGYLARIEHFCVGVNSGIYDKNTVYELAYGYFDEMLYKRIEPVMFAKSCRGKNHYENITRFYQWMDKRKKKINKSGKADIQKRDISLSR